MGLKKGKKKCWLLIERITPTCILPAISFSSSLFLSPSSFLSSTSSSTPAFKDEYAVCWLLKISARKTKHMHARTHAKKVRGRVLGGSAHWCNYQRPLNLHFAMFSHFWPEQTWVDWKKGDEAKRQRRRGGPGIRGRCEGERKKERRERRKRKRKRRRRKRSSEAIMVVRSSILHSVKKHSNFRGKHQLVITLH